MRVEFILYKLNIKAEMDLKISEWTYPYYSWVLHSLITLVILSFLNDLRNVLKNFTLNSSPRGLEKSRSEIPVFSLVWWYFNIFEKVLIVRAAPANPKILLIRGRFIFALRRYSIWANKIIFFDFQTLFYCLLFIVIHWCRAQNSVKFIII